MSCRGPNDSLDLGGPQAGPTGDSAGLSRCLLSLRAPSPGARSRRPPTRRARPAQGRGSLSVPAPRVPRSCLRPTPARPSRASARLRSSTSPRSPRGRRVRGTDTSHSLMPHARNRARRPISTRVLPHRVCWSCGCRRRHGGRYRESPRYQAVPARPPHKGHHQADLQRPREEHRVRGPTPFGRRIATRELSLPTRERLPTAHAIPHVSS